MNYVTYSCFRQRCQPLIPSDFDLLPHLRALHTDVQVTFRTPGGGAPAPNAYAQLHRTLGLSLRYRTDMHVRSSRI